MNAVGTVLSELLDNLFAAGYISWNRLAVIGHSLGGICPHLS